LLPGGREPLFGYFGHVLGITLTLTLMSEYLIVAHQRAFNAEASPKQGGEVSSRKRCELAID
jgi:hypothetical protein